MTTKKIIEKIKILTGNAPDITYKNINISNNTITLIYSNSVSSSSSINDFILRRIDEDKNNLNKDNMYDYFKNYIPNNSMVDINSIEDCIYYITSGFTVVLFDDNNKILGFENKAKLYSGIIRSENEKSLIGPSDSFCENYEINTGLIRKRLKTEKLWIKDIKVGTLSKTKVSIFYINGICDQNFVNSIYKKIKEINIKYVGNINYILDAISNPNRSIFPTNLRTERADYVCQKLLEGRIVLMCENSNQAIILPCNFIDFFKSPDDYYEKSVNVFISRLIRIASIILALLTPAIYISLMAYNLEAIPSKLLINFSIQRDGVPFSTVFEILVMSFMFQILRESDARYPGKGSSSISIVGALVLGEAAVEAGIVSPITIIIVGISSVACLPFTSIELINSIRIWQFILIILAALFGFVGVLFGIIIILGLLVSQKSCGKPYLSPFEPFSKSGQKDALFCENDIKFDPNNILKEDNNEEN